MQHGRRVVRKAAILARRQIELQAAVLELDLLAGAVIDIETRGFDAALSAA
jgi:hypothetical protein